MSEAIVLRPYDPGWPVAFERERRAIAPLFTEAPQAIEHIGSTAIPGLGAKPVVDIMVLVDTLVDARGAIPALEATGYSYWAANPDTERLFLVKGLPPAPTRTHHLHIVADADELRRHLVFRDHLRADAGAREAYLALKAELAIRFADDREAYSTEKSAFIDGLVLSLGGPPRRQV